MTLKYKLESNPETIEKLRGYGSVRKINNSAVYHISILEKNINEEVKRLFKNCKIYNG